MQLTVRIPKDKHKTCSRTQEKKLPSQSSNKVVKSCERNQAARCWAGEPMTNAEQVSGV